MQAKIQASASASALWSKQTISSFKAFGRGQTETIQGQIVFYFISDVVELQ